MTRRKSKLPRRAQLRLIGHFVAGTTARMAAELVGVNRNTATLLYHELREVITERIADESPFGGEIEIDESYSGGHREGKRGRGAAGETVVFGIHKRGGKVCTAVPPDLKRDALLPIIRRQVEPDSVSSRTRCRAGLGVEPDSVVIADGFNAYDTLDAEGFEPERVSHSETLVQEGPNGRALHINGIESFRSQAKRHLRKYNGIPEGHFELFLKECEWRFNYGTPRELLKTLRRWTLNLGQPLPYYTMTRSLFLVLILLVVAACSAPVETTRPARSLVAADTGYSEGPATRRGTGRYYMGREVAQVMGHQGAAWLERPDRAAMELPEAVVDSLGLSPDDVVADIGAGTGYFTARLARRVPEGTVYAVDVQPEMLEWLERRLDAEGISNVRPVLGYADDPNLPPESVDVALVVDAYHEFGYPREMLQGIHRALRPGGRLVLVEYRAEDEGLAIHPLHRMSEAQARRELEANGFRWVETKDFLPLQHFLVFEKR